jgi:predicted GH43/DUF377 family glycosyl hydrolase
LATTCRVNAASPRLPPDVPAAVQKAHPERECFAVSVKSGIFGGPAGEYSITYSAYSRNGVRIALAKTKDFVRLEKIGLIAEADYRNVVICPEKLISPWSIWLIGTKIIGVCDSWILQPEDPWEITAYVHNVVFTCGALSEPDGTVKIW